MSGESVSVMNAERECALPGISGKVAVITGGASGIGKAIAWRLSRLGARVAVIDISSELGDRLVDEVRAEGAEALFCRGNVTEQGEMAECMGRIASCFGEINILVNNAGITTTIPFDELGLEEWTRIIDINLTGTFVCTKAAAQFLRKQESASIIMISSGSSITGSGGSIAYASSKGGINSMVRALARELASSRIRVNGVAPRAIRGSLLNNLYSEGALQEMIHAIPLRRLGTAEDVADTVAFLASDLSSFITGETILVDGGRTYCS